MQIYESFKRWLFYKIRIFNKGKFAYANAH